MIFSPSKPLKIVRNSRVDHPPVSGVPVAGANAGSIESILLYNEDVYDTANKSHSRQSTDRLVYHPQSPVFF